MEMLQMAKSSNDFGLRRQFPWSTSDPKSPWIIKINRSAEESYVKSLLKPTLHRRDKIQIYRVENPYLWARYILRHEELNANTGPPIVSEHIVFHATDWSKALQIVDENFNWRLVTRARFGQGVSFSKDPSYADRYASEQGVWMITGIPVGHKSIGNYYTVIPPPEHDTTGDRADKVYVKYYDDDFYPYYLVHRTYYYEFGIGREYDDYSDYVDYNYY